jgi:hypothetical protein
MKIDVKFRDEDGNVTLEGYLNRNEVSFLLQFAINELMAEGVRFNIANDLDEDEEPDDDDEARLEFPKEELN